LLPKTPKPLEEIINKISFCRFRAFSVQVFGTAPSFP